MKVFEIEDGTLEIERDCSDSSHERPLFLDWFEDQILTACRVSKESGTVKWNNLVGGKVIRYSISIIFVIL